MDERHRRLGACHLCRSTTNALSMHGIDHRKAPLSPAFNQHQFGEPPLLDVPSLFRNAGEPRLSSYVLVVDAHLRMGSLALLLTNVTQKNLAILRHPH